MMHKATDYLIERWNFGGLPENEAMVLKIRRHWFSLSSININDEPVWILKMELFCASFCTAMIGSPPAERYGLSDFNGWWQTHTC